MVLEQDTFIPNLVLVQPRKTRSCSTERLLMGLKESNQTNKIHSSLIFVYMVDVPVFVVAPEIVV